jgi:hypothetical protein
MSEIQYSTDKPIEKASEDEFSRADFSKNVAKTIASTALNDGYVIGLYSKWGYGKTSTLNMITGELSKHKNIVVIKFNPWLFTDQQSMINGLFSTLTTAIGKNLKTKKEEFGNLLGKLGGAISTVTFSTDPVSGSFGSAAKGVGVLLNDADLNELKQRVNKILEESDLRLVVIIDDVDRLDKDEVFQLFKLIKIAVDFKKVIYLVAFDDVAVGRVLNQRFGDLEEESGQNFIEKIVQVPLTLPYINQQQLTSYLMRGLGELFQDKDIAVSSSQLEVYKSIYKDELSIKFDSPRMVIRYLNALNFILPLVGEEIDIADLLLIEAIRMLYPEQYRMLRKMKSLLTGSLYIFMAGDKENLVFIKSEINQKFSKYESLVPLLRSLFPEVDNAFKDGTRSQVDAKQLKLQKNVASPDYFDRYFTYGISADDVSDVSLLEIISQPMAEDIARGLNDLIKSNNALKVITKIMTYADQKNDGFELAKAIVLVANQFPNPNKESFNSTPLEISVDAITKLLRKSKGNSAKEVKAVMKAMDETDQLALFVRDVRLYSEESESDKWLNETELAEVLLIFDKKMEKLAKRSTPIHDQSNSLGVHLYSFWAKSAGVEVVQKYLDQFLKSPESALKLLTKYTSVWYGSGPPRRGDLDSSNFRFMSEVIDTDKMYDVLKSNNQPELVTMPQFSQNVSNVGNENTDEFKNTLRDQFIFLYQRFKNTKS